MSVKIVLIRQIHFSKNDKYQLFINFIKNSSYAIISIFINMAINSLKKVIKLKSSLFHSFLINIISKK